MIWRRRKTEFDRMREAGAAMIAERERIAVAAEKARAKEEQGFRDAMGGYVESLRRHGMKTSHLSAYGGDKSPDPDEFRRREDFVSLWGTVAIVLILGGLLKLIGIV